MAERLNEKKPGAVGEPVKPGAPKRDEENDCDSLDKSTENHRYYIAVLLLGGLIAIMGIPVLFKNYDSAADLAAIFSGWITSVVGFYFLQQNTEKAQQQTTIATKNAAEARKEAMGAAKKTAALVDVNEVTLFEYKKKFEEAKSKALDYEGLFKEAQTMINEIMEMLEQDGD